MTYSDNSDYRQTFKYRSEAVQVLIADRIADNTTHLDGDSVWDEYDVDFIADRALEKFDDLWMLDPGMSTEDFWELVATDPEE